MKKNLKCLFVALLALGLTAPAFADDAVLVPSQQGGFKVGIDALYLRSTSIGLDYATRIVFPTDASSLGTASNAIIDPSYHLGAYLQAGYLFPCTGNDLTLGYTYLSNDSTSSITAPAPIINGTSATATGGIFVLPILGLFTIGTTGGFGSAQGKVEYTLDVVDLEAGQRFTSGSYDMRMFAGLRYANIDSTLSTLALPYVLAPNITGGSINRVLSAVQDFNSEFRGIGPRLGVDARYCLSSGFGVDMNVSTALLVGNTNSHYNATLIPAGFSTSSFHAENPSTTRIVPVLEAKLGLDYAFAFCSNGSALILEAGYQVTNYFNASDHNFSILSTKASTFGSTLSSGGANDVAFDGPYLGVKYYA